MASRENETDQIDPSAYFGFLEGVEDRAQYDAFSYYRDSPPHARNMSAVARTFGLEPNTIYRWAKACQWADRCEVFDVAQIEARDRALGRTREEQIAAWERDRSALLDTALAGVRIHVERMLRDALEGSRPMRPNELVRWLDVITRLQDVGAGKASAIVDHRGQIDLSGASEEAIAALERAREIFESIGASNVE